MNNIIYITHIIYTTHIVNVRERYQNIPKKQKQKPLECIRNYYLAHKKYIFSCFFVAFLIFRQVKKEHCISLSGISGIFFLVMPYKKIFKLFIFIE